MARKKTVARSSSRESSDDLKKRAVAVIRVLKKTYPDAKCSLDFRNPYELIVATILSAQCTDARVNLVTPQLFQRFPNPLELSQADTSEVEMLIRSTGFYKNKTKSLIGMAQAVTQKHAGKVPDTLEALVALPGVGRKTANVVLGNAFGIPGMVVDTHVGRLTRRLGFTRQTDPVKVEFEIMEIVPRKDWTIFSHDLVFHGRAYCMARNPQCGKCPLLKLCPQIGVKK